MRELLEVLNTKGTAVTTAELAKDLKASTEGTRKQLNREKEKGTVRGSSREGWLITERGSSATSKMENNLGAVIKERRKEKKLSLSQLSEVSGVSLSHINRIEKGNRFPSARVLMKLAVLLDFSEIELLKLAGLLSRDEEVPVYESDERIDRLKYEINKEIADFLASVQEILNRS